MQPFYTCYSMFNEMHTLGWFVNTTQEVTTEELEAAGDVTLDDQTIEQLQQAHKELKIQLQTETRLLEKKKVMLEKQKKNQGTLEKTTALQVRNLIM